MKTKVKEIEREFEVGDTFQLGREVRVIRSLHLDNPIPCVAFYDVGDMPSSGQIWWLNESLDSGEIVYLGKVMKLGQHPEVDV